LANKNPVRCIGILTSGGDCPGLNAAIRAVVRAAHGYGMEVVGIRDGFRGLVERQAGSLKPSDVSGILTLGGTILGTSRDKPHKMPMGSAGKMDLTAAAIANYHNLHLDCLFCLGGGGTQKNAFHLAREGGINVVTLPKTIDNDVARTDYSFGFDTAFTVATEALDRLHTTASSHHRIMVVEIMGHRAGWLALSSGVAAGADVILIPEIPYDPQGVAAALKERARTGKRFSILAVAEGAITRQEAEEHAADSDDDSDDGETRNGKGKSKSKKAPPDISSECGTVYVKATASQRVAKEVEELTGLETRVTALSHLQRGGTPTPTDRLLATQLGTRAVDLVSQGKSEFMMAVQGNAFVPVPLEEVAGKLKLVPHDHELIHTAREVGTYLGT
jgi:6-phosphofructokinase 1